MRESELPPKQKYLDETFGLPDKELEAVRAAMNEQGVSRISLAPSEARLLGFLIRQFRVRSVVEIGTLFGYSALAMAAALPEDGRLFTCEKNPENHRRAQETFARSSRGHKIQGLLGDATELLLSLEKQGPFDLVFIDADKGGYMKYLEWAEKNLRPGGLIVGDNTFLFGALWSGPNDSVTAGTIEVMKAFNRRLADPALYDSILIPTAEGMTVAVKR